MFKLNTTDIATQSKSLMVSTAMVSIVPGSERALAIRPEELRVMYYTGRSESYGTGRDKVTTYRTGVQTELGDVEISQWQALMRDIIRRNGELELLAHLTEWELEMTPWVHTKKEAEQRALEAFATRRFDDPSNRNYESFNRKYRPELLAQNQSDNERNEQS